MPQKRKSVYRGFKRSASPSVKIIIALLIIIIITLAAFLFKDRIASWFEPSVTYPDTDEAAKTAKHPDETASDPGETENAALKTREISASEYDPHRGDLVIVNASVPYSFSDKDEAELINLYAADHGSFSLASAAESLRKEAYEALLSLTGKYKEMYGFCPIMVTASYRSYDAQAKYYEDNVKTEQDGKYYEAAGYSDHHTGLAFDVKLFDENGDSYSYARYASIMVEWIVDHYKEYGFIMRYPASKGALTGVDSEANHFRYVGVPHSVYMTDNSLCLEEYEEILRARGKDDPLIIEYNGKAYYVWYCGAEDGYIYIPEEYEYSVSGDNHGGFIVTAVLPRY